jgi:predicted small metal-binding protein
VQDVDLKERRVASTSVSGNYYGNRATFVYHFETDSPANSSLKLNHSPPEFCSLLQSFSPWRLLLKQFSCGDVVPGCKAVFRAEDESGIFAHVAEHAQRDHGMTSIPDALVEQVRSHIREVSVA